MTRWTVLARMPDRSIGGVLFSTASRVGAEFKLTLRHNEVGSWQLDVPAEVTPSGWPAPQAGVIFLREDRVVASGMWDTLSYAKSFDEPGLISLTGDTDLARVAYRHVYPSPDNAWDNQVNTHYRHLARPETALRVIVSRQAGPAAQVARRSPGVTIAPDSNIPGTDFQVEERFSLLLEAARKIAAAGDLGFDIVDTLQGTMQFRVWPTRDLTNTIRFGWQLNNVTEFSFGQESAKANVALVAGQEEGVDRQAVEVVDNASEWDRREVFVDQRQSDEEGEHQKAGEDAIAEAREKASVKATIVDTDTTRWKRDYDVGDRVSVITPHGDISEVVREVDISVDSTGVEEVQTTIGSEDALESSRLAKEFRRLAARVSQLERGL